MNNPWEKICRPDQDVNVIRVSENHPLSMYWGRDFNGRYLFVYETKICVEIIAKKLPKLEGITLVSPSYKDKFRLILVLNDKSDSEMFYSLCMDLIRGTSNLPNGIIPYHVIIRRLIRWQSFLKRKRSELLSNEQIKGLIGEILLMEEKVSVRFGWEQTIMFWKGPEGAPQDFSIHDSVIEVKCQSGGSKPTVKISSAEQLIPQVPEGYLAVYTITTTEQQDLSSFSLNDLVSRVFSKLENESEETLERFSHLLDKAGYIYREEYESPRYKKIDLVCYGLKDSFPRIKLTDIKPGIENVSYQLRLEACDSFRSSPSWWE
jgi:hypothetical protein